MGNLKTVIRNLLPSGVQVSAKYLFRYIKGNLEPEMRLLPQLVSKGDRVIDVGGNRGVYAYRLAQLGARVSIFEPNPACLAILSPWAKKRRAVEIYPYALSSQSGIANLAIPVDVNGFEHDASASIEHDPTPGVRHEEVEMRPLDSFGIRDATLIKIDVEGHESSVIDGAIETIMASKPALIIEIEQRHIERPISMIFDRIAKLGYKGYFVDGSKVRSITEFSVSTDQAHQEFGRPGARYINNFLFLANEKVNAGRYKGIAG